MKFGHLAVQHGDAMGAHLSENCKIGCIDPTSGLDWFARGFGRAELRRVRELTFEHEGFFVERWNEYFGHQR